MQSHPEYVHIHPNVSLRVQRYTKKMTLANKSAIFLIFVFTYTLFGTNKLLNLYSFDAVALKQGVDGRFTLTETDIQIHSALCSTLL